MPEEQTTKSGSALPPKLTARKIVAGAGPVAARPVAFGAAPGTTGIEARPPTPAVASVPTLPLAPAPGIIAERKKDTSKISLDEARPVPAGAEPVVRTVRMKAPGPTIVAAGAEPAAVAAPSVPPAGPEDAAQGIQSKRKSDTSRIDLGEAVKPVDQGGATVGQVRTVRIKSGPAAAAFVGTQPLTVDTRPSAPPPPPQPVSDQEPPGGRPGIGPATIRLKRPDGLRPAGGIAPRLGADTSRITIESPVAPAAIVEEKVQESLEEAGGPRTVRIKKADQPESGAEQAAPAASSGRRTIKIARPGHSAEQVGPEATPPQDAPATQKRTLSIKRTSEDHASEHSLKLARDEAALNIRKGAKPEGTIEAEVVARKPERFAWAWCIVSLAAMVVIGIVMWMFWVQLNPTVEHEWPGKILNFNDAFYKNERAWL
ncbi:MAG: hypothetical protein WCL44_03220 [bacterium]